MSGPAEVPTVTVICFEWDELVDLVVDPEIIGCALVELHGDGWGRVGFTVRPDLPADVFDLAADWAVQRLGRFLQAGPEPDGWQKRADGAWQLWARLVDMPRAG